MIDLELHSVKLLIVVFLHLLFKDANTILQEK